MKFRLRELRCCVQGLTGIRRNSLDENCKGAWSYRTAGFRMTPAIHEVRWQRNVAGRRKDGKLLVVGATGLEPVTSCV